jgi:hypothetical protein
MTSSHHERSGVVFPRTTLIRLARRAAAIGVIVAWGATQRAAVADTKFYEIPAAAALDLEIAAVSRGSGVFTVKGKVRALVDGLTTVKVYFVPGTSFTPVGTLPTFHGTIKKGESMTIAGKLRVGPGFKADDVGLHATFDFPHAALAREAAAHPERFPDPGARGDMSKRIEEGKGTQAHASRVRRVGKP